MTVCESRLVMVPAEHLDETYLGTRVLITINTPGGLRTICGGVSDVARALHVDFATNTTRRCVLLWVAGEELVLGADAHIVTEAPPTP